MPCIVVGSKNIYNEVKESFTNYLNEKKLRKTKERYAILKAICTFPGRFDIFMLHEKLEEDHFHVSKATLYNALIIFIDAGIVYKHQINSDTNSTQYKLKKLAETHLLLICTKCGEVRNIKNNLLPTDTSTMKISRFTPEFFSLNIYGLCSKCKYQIQRSKKKQQ